MQLYKIGKRKGFGVLAFALIGVALLFSFADIFKWISVPSTLPFILFRMVLATLVVLVWLVLNLPPPKLPTGKFIIALAEFGQEIRADGGYYGELRAARKRPMQFSRRAEEIVYLDDDNPGLEGSRYLESLRQKRRAQPIAALQDATQLAALPSPSGKKELRSKNIATINSLAMQRNEPDSVRTTVQDSPSPPVSSGRAIFPAHLNTLVVTNEIGEPSQPQPQRLKFTRPEYLDNWKIVTGPRELSTYLKDTLSREINEADVSDLAIFPTDFADDGPAAIQLAEQNRAHAVIWGWNVFQTRREFVPVFEILAPLEDSHPPIGDMQIMGLSSFELGLNTARYSTVFSAFVTGLGAYGLRRFEQARTEFSLALIAATMNECHASYHNKEGRAIIYFYLGNAYYYCNQLEKALRCYQEAWALDVELYEARNNMGVILALQGKLDFAIKSFIGVIRDNPDQPVPRYNLGMSYLEKGDFGKCRRELSNSIKLDSRYAVAYRGLGLSYFRELIAGSTTGKEAPKLPDAKGRGESEQQLLYEDAITRIGEALRLKPDYAAARVDLGRIRLHQASSPHYGENSRTRFYEQATAELQEAIRLDPSLVEAHYELGQIMRHQNDLESAVVSLKEAARLCRNDYNPYYALSHYALGEIYHQRGQLDLAKDEFKEATRARAAISPASTQDFINQGIGFLGNQQYQEAREAFGKALELEPDNAEAMLNMGAVYQELGNYNQAFTIFQNVLKQPAPPEEVYNRLSRLYMQLGDEKSSFDTLKTAADRNPRSARLQYWLGNAYRRMKEETQAMSCYIKSFKIDPDIADARFNLAMIYLGRKQIQDAILQFTEVVRIRPDDFSTFIFLGRAYLQLGQIQESINALNEAIRIKPDAVEALLALGQIYQRQAEAELAVSQYETALTYAPNDLRIRELLASAYALAGKVELSIEQFQAILSAEPGPEQQAHAHYNLGVAYTSREKYDLAAIEFTEYVKLKPGDADGYFNLGLAYKNQSQVMESIEALSKAIELRPTYATAYQLRGQLFIAINDNEKGIADLQAFQNLKARQ
jgi:tetratricopeptide (TPR) repeat protein